MALDESHDVGGKDALGDGCSPGGGFRIHGEGRVFAAKAIGCAPDELAVVDDGDLGAGDVLRGERRAGKGVCFCDGDAGAIETADGVGCVGLNHACGERAERDKL